MNNHKYQQFLYSLGKSVLIEQTSGDLEDFMFGDKNFNEIVNNLQDYSLEEIHCILVMYDFQTNYNNTNNNHRRKIVHVSKYIEDYLRHKKLGQNMFACYQDVNADSFIYPIFYAIKNQDDNDYVDFNGNKYINNVYHVLNINNDEDSNDNKDNYNNSDNEADNEADNEKYSYDMEKKFSELAMILGDQDETLGNLIKEVAINIGKNDPKKIFDTISNYLEIRLPKKQHDLK
jgi:hypothetical protein